MHEPGYIFCPLHSVTSCAAKSCPRPLHCPILRHRYLEPFVATECPIHQCSDNDGAQKRTCVVHVASRDRQYCREGHPNHNVQQVRKREYIGGDAVAAEFEWAIRYMFSTNLPQHEEKDWWNVRDAQ